MSLRDGLENEFAEVLHDHGPGRSGKPPSKDWRDCFNADAHGGTAPRLVDALCDYLTEHADEWWDRGCRLADEDGRAYDCWAGDLVAVLAARRKGNQ